MKKFYKLNQLREMLKPLATLVLLFAFIVNVSAIVPGGTTITYLNEGFNTDPLLSMWTVDRYAPHAFDSYDFNGDKVLRISIDGTNDGLANRPNGYNNYFYNTQGRAYDQTGLNVTVAKGSLYIPSDWATKHRRSDMWGVAKDNSGAVVNYPIIGFRNVDGIHPSYSYWDESAGGWVNNSTPITYDAWTTFEIKLDGTNFRYYINNIEVGHVDATGSVNIGSIIMQAYNFNDNTLDPSYYDNSADNSYDAYWDNVITQSNIYNVTQQTYAPTIQAAIDAASPGDEIDVAAGTYEFTSQLNIDKSGISIIGQGNVMFKANNATWSTTNGYKHLIGIYAGTSSNPVTISNVTMNFNSQCYGLNAYNNAYINLNSVTINGSKGAGLTVNGSTVIATNLITATNAWGAVNVDPGSGVTTPSVFTLNSGTLAENTQIWSDGSYATGSATVTVNATGYNKYKTGNVKIWTNRPLTNYATITTSGETAIYSTIQAAIDAASTGDIINVYPGNYSETATNCYTVSLQGTAGPYQFGLYFPVAKPGITVRGVDASGNPITNYANVVASITTNATNSFGSSGVFVNADNITIQGLKFLDNYSNGSLNNNKTIEIIGDNFSMKYSYVDIAEGGSIYFNDWSFASNTSTQTKYNLTGNNFAKGCSVDICSGTGYTGSVSDRVIANNVFSGFDCIYDLTWGAISFNGICPSVGWFNNPVGAATLSGNTFTDYSKFIIRTRGTVATAQFNWQNYLANNTFEKAVITLSDVANFTPRSYSYSSFTDVVRIGGEIQQDITNVAQANDVVLVGAGAYAENLSIGKSISILGPNATTSPNTGSRVAEAILQPHQGSDAIIPTANSINVVLKGITIDMISTVKENRYFTLNSKSNTGWTFEKNIFKNAQYSTNGSWWFSGSAVSNLTLNDNYFTANAVSNGLMVAVGCPAISITNNVWENNGYTALNLNAVVGTISGNTFRDTRTVNFSDPNYYFGDYQSGILLASANNNLNISGNTFTNVHYGVVLYQSADGTISITGNHFDGTLLYSVRLSGSQSGGHLNNVTVHGNSFLNYAGSNPEFSNARTDGQVLNATCNWFGTANANLIAPRIDANITYIPYSVSEGGSCLGGPVTLKHSGYVIAAYATIPEAVSAASTGDEIDIANGTYVLSSTLYINKSLSIIGQSEAGVIIDLTTVIGYGFNIQTDNITMKNFTVLPNPSQASGTYALKTNPIGTTPWNYLTYDHITINGGGRTPFDIHGYNNATLTNITATNTLKGVGIALSGCNGVTMNHITTSGNAWGGIAIYVSTYVHRGSNNVTIDGTTSTIGEDIKIFSQDENGFTNTNTTVTGYDYLIKNPTNVDHCLGYTYYQIDKTTAYGFASALPSPQYSSVKKISTDEYWVGSTLKIQAAIDAASSGNVVNVDAGTYDISSVLNITKGLTIKGANAGIAGIATTRGAESILVDSRAAHNNPGAITICSSAIVLDGFTYQGSKILTGQPANANFTLMNNRFILQAWPDGGQTGMIYSTGCNLTLDHNYFETTGYNASNSALLQVAGGYTGSGTSDMMTMTNNYFKGITSQPLSAYVSSNPNQWSGITTSQLNFANCQGTVSGNTFDGVDVGVIIANGCGSLSVTGNIFENQTRGTYDITHNGSFGAGVAIYNPSYTGPITISGNTFQNSDAGIRTSTDGSSYTESGSISISGNTFTGNLYDIVDKMSIVAFDLAGDNIIAGTAISSATTNQLFAIEDKIIHKVDNSSYGFINYKANNIYVTTNSYFTPGGTTTPSIQRGIDAASAGDVVNVASGNYSGNMNLTKNVTILGQASGTGRPVIAGYVTKDGSLSAFDGMLLQNLIFRSTGALLDFAAGTVISGNGLVFNNTDFDFIGTSTPTGPSGYLAPITFVSANISGSTGLKFLNSTLSISGNPILNGLYSMVWMQATGGPILLDGVTLKGSYTDGGIVTGAQFNKGSASTNMEIKNSSTLLGGNFYLSDITGLSIHDNSFTNSGMGLNNVENVEVQNNTFTTIDQTYKCGGSGSGTTNRVIQMEAAWGDNTSHLRHINIHDNTFTNISNVKAIYVTRFTSLDPNSTTYTDVKVNHNDFSGVSGNVITSDYVTAPIDATCNWYNLFDASLIGAKISGSTITYAPFLTSLGGSCNGMPVNVTLLTSTNPSCSASTDGIIKITISGGTAPYYISKNGASPITSYLANNTFTGLGIGTYSFTVTDANGSIGTFAQTLTANNTPVTITGTSNQSVNLTTACTAVVNYTVTPSVNSISTTYVFTGATTGSGTGTGTGATFNKGVTHVTVSTSNLCTSASTDFYVTVQDVTPPSFTSVASITRATTTSFYTVVSADNLMPTITDACSGVTSYGFTLSGATIQATPITSIIGKVLNIGTTTVTWTATDGSGNTTPLNSYQYTVTVTAASGITGIVKYANNAGTPLDNLVVTLKLHSTGAVIGSPYTTTSTGVFTFLGIQNGSYDILVSPINANWTKYVGVNATDATLVNGFSKLTATQQNTAIPSGIKRTSADVDDLVGAITTTDGSKITAAFTSSNFTGFVIPKWVFTSDVGTTSFQAPGALISGITVSNSLVSVNIQGLCAGDVNASAAVAELTGVKQATTPNIELLKHTSIAVNNNVVSIPVKAECDMEMGAISLIFDYDASKIDITGVAMPNQGDAAPVYGITNINEIRIGWSSLTPVKVSKGETILNIIAHVKVSANEMIGFTLNESPLSEIATTEAVVLKDAKISIADIGGTSSKDMFTVYPNPAKDILNIEYTMDNSGTFRADLYNIEGAVVGTIETNTRAAGIYKETININNLASGIYTLRVYNGNTINNQKIVITK